MFFVGSPYRTFGDVPLLLKDAVPINHAGDEPEPLGEKFGNQPRNSGHCSSMVLRSVIPG